MRLVVIKDPTLSTQSALTESVFLRSGLQLLVTVCFQLTVFSILLKEATSSSETSVLTRAAQRRIQEDGILQSHCRENLKLYNRLTNGSECLSLMYRSHSTPKKHFSLSGTHLY
jgi:hypothetical protein